MSGHGSLAQKAFCEDRSSKHSQILLRGKDLKKKKDNKMLAFAAVIVW